MHAKADTRQEAAPAAWSGRSRGGPLGNLFFIWVVRLLGLRAAYFFLVPVAAYFLVAAPKSVRASSDYLQRVLGPLPPLRRLAAIYRHFFTYGRALLDRVLILGGGADRFEFIHDGEENIRAALAEGKGAILLGAHMGNPEIAGHLLERYNVPVNVVWLETEAARMRSVMERSMQGRSFRIIPIDAHFTQVIDILQALRRGEFVAMHGDRTWGGRAVRVPFFGSEADFPVGIYLLAAAAEAPIVQTFSLREGGRRFRLTACPPMHIVKPARSAREAFLRDCAARFAARLEETLRRHPYQWQNFYPFWEPGQK